MKLKPNRKEERRSAKSILRLPDLEVRSPRSSTVFPAPMLSAAVDMQLTNSWSGTAPSRRLSFSKTVVVRYRMHLESRRLAPGTINLRLGAVRRLAYEAADCGLLSAGLSRGNTTSEGRKEIGVEAW
jgi:hypothetical protein